MFLQHVPEVPDPKIVQVSLELLRSLGALDQEERLTPLGFHLAQLPVDPRTGKLILMGAIFGCLEPILSIAAALSFKDPFVIPLNKEDLVRQTKKKLANESRSDHLLIARRLIEAGVRVVSLSFGRWDSHSKNFDMVRDHGGKLDQCLSALVEDLESRGMLDDVSIVVWGEFGRTPKINKEAGRDHWSPVSCAWLAGGGIRPGQVIGETNRLGEYATLRPVHVQEVIATLYHNLGINVSTTTLPDPTGRPQFLVEHEPIRELI